MKIADRYLKGAALIGGMCQIWEATDTRLNREVTLKLIRRPADGDALRRFYREARILGRFRHPGIPALYDFGTDGDDLFIVMELIPGAVSLRDLIDASQADPIPVPWVAAIGAQVCAALAAAHQASLIHRGLTPASIVLAPNGTVKILDFGVAVGPSDLSTITRPGEAPGSLPYLGPELDGDTKATVHSDLYSLGCVLYELLTGERVFHGDSEASEIGRHRMSDEPGLHIPGRPDVERRLETLVLALLRMDPAERPTDAVTVFSALLPYAQNLPPLPGFFNELPDDPARLYAVALARLPR